MARRPNIVLITSDQHRADCYGFEGRRVRTPYLDRMARAGTRFSAAITPNLVCQPSRASILTGLLPLSHGVVDNEVSLDPAIAERGWARGGDVLFDCDLTGPRRTSPPDGGIERVI